MDTNSNINLSLIHPDLLPLPEPPSRREIKLSDVVQSPTNTDFCESGCGYISSINESERNTNEYINEIFPPSIIPAKYYDIGDGNMPFIKEKLTRKMCENAWKAIDLTENWDFVSQPIESFSGSNDNRINIITNKMIELGYNGHSRCSFGCTMRNMQFLVKNGLEKFKKIFHEEEKEVYNPIINNKPIIGDKNTIKNMTFVYCGGF